MRNELLVVDDEPDVRLGFSLYLKKAGFAVHEAGSLAEARQALLTRSIDAVLLDLNLPDGNGLDWIAEVRDERPGAAIVVVTGKGDIPLAVEAMRRGADHFLTKPVNMNELEVFLRRGLEVAGMRRTALAQRRLSGTADPSFGDGLEVKAALELAALAADNDSPVLLLGETGCGKGVLARWIHDRSPRAAAPFVEVSCAGLRGELLASELFGHTRGAFTSAVSDREGLLDVADGGTLFLDEIGELDLDVQAQFLKVLEEKRYRRVGDTRERRSEFRLICATNRDLEQRIARGSFRAELYFRINVFPIRLPPLRRRLDELPRLTAHLLAGLGSPGADVTGAAMELLRGYPWPGNVRELRNALERALLLARGGAIGPEHLSWLAEDAPPAIAEPPAAPPDSEPSHIEDVLRHHGGRVADAARALGVSRATLYRRLRALRGGDA